MTFNKLQYVNFSKISLLFFILISCFCFGQIRTDTISETRTYQYSQNENAELVKMKTEFYLSKIQRDKVYIKKISISDDTFYMEFLIPTEKTNETIGCNVTYMFLENSYTSFITNPFIYNDKTKKITLINIDLDLFV